MNTHYKNINNSYSQKYLCHLTPHFLLNCVSFSFFFPSEDCYVYFSKGWYSGNMKS